MIKNAEATRERILAAATTEFSAHGIAGARVDRIAREARANKNLIYVYFGSKEALFAAVLERHLRRVYDTVPITAEDLPGYAGRIFDFCLANPELLRLMHWSALERKEGSPPPGRTAATEAKVKAVAKGQREGSVSRELPPAFLLTAALLVASAWTGADPFGIAIEPQAARHLPTIRKAVTKAVALLCGGPSQGTGKPVR